MSYRSYQGFQFNVTWTLIAVNFVVFIATNLAPSLVLFLGLQPAKVAVMPWTIITSMFTHHDFWHILTNMLTLYFFGTYLSGMVGENKLLLVYLCGGILGNILFMLMAPPFSIGIGASGAIYALGGVLVVMRPSTMVYIMPLPVPLPLWVAILGGFLIISFVPGIAWQAHLGGLIFGLAAGYYFRNKERRGYYRY